MNWEELKESRTDELIDLIKKKDQVDHYYVAEAAFITFTFRFNNEIIDKCRKVGRKWGYDSDTCDMLAQRTFERFWNYPSGFDKMKCKSMLIDVCVKFYLFRIAQNCFFDYYKELAGSIGPYDGTEEVVVTFPSVDHLQLPEGKVNDLRKIHDAIEEALSMLSPKHKIIYLTYKAYEKEGFKLPRHLLKKLRAELELTQNSIRVYKKEAFDKVDQFVQAHGTK